MCVGGDETILLIEDDEYVRKSCKHSLEQCGYTVLYSEGAMKAFQEHSGNIDLILTHVVMPNMNVAEMFELLVPGMNFLQKPFSLDSPAENMQPVLDE